jgi:hypothetical protein
MTNYDTMTVHDLVLEAAKDGMQGFLHDASPELCELPEIESALRRAVIREASVGMCNFYLAEDESGCLVPMYYTFDTAGKNFEADGVYYLIPKEG